MLICIIFRNLISNFPRFFTTIFSTGFSIGSHIYRWSFSFVLQPLHRRRTENHCVHHSVEDFHHYPSSTYRQRLHLSLSGLHYILRAVFPSFFFFRPHFWFVFDIHPCIHQAVSWNIIGLTCRQRVDIVVTHRLAMVLHLQLCWVRWQACIPRCGERDVYPWCSLVQ